jgi:hypothetical protein
VAQQHEPTVSEGIWAGLKFCRTCHLVWPCLDGRILAYAADLAVNSRQTVAQITAVIQAEDRAYLTRLGQRRQAPRAKTHCRRGHPLRGDNVLLERDGIRRCKVCRQNSLHQRLRRHHAPRPPETGVCQKGLHFWVAENWVVDKHGAVRCRPCREHRHREIYARTQVIPCLIKNCPRATHRPANSGNYICKFHRAHPPRWIAATGLSVVGTRVVPGKA